MMAMVWEWGQNDLAVRGVKIKLTGIDVYGFPVQVSKLKLSNFNLGWYLDGRTTRNDYVKLLLGQNKRHHRIKTIIIKKNEMYK